MIERIMTQMTYAELLAKRRKVEEELRGLGADRDGGHQRQDLHDNPAVPARQVELRLQLERLGRLDEVSIIKPPEDTSTVSLGAQVEIEQDGDQWTGILLGPDDVSSTRQREDALQLISYESPLGKALMGRSIGDEVKFGSHGKESTAVIVSISAGKV